MNHLRAVQSAVVMMVCLLWVPSLWAHQVETRVVDAQVVYVEGNDVVLRLPGGEVQQFQIPDSTRLTVDGRVLAVEDLKPGMKLTATITTADPPRWVDSVKVMEIGTVWKTIGSNLIITAPDGENMMFRVPSGGKITLGGKVVSLNQLHEGDKISVGTVVTTEPPLEASKTTAHIRRSPVTPARVGPLLIDEGAKPGDTAVKQGTNFLPILIVILLLLIAIAAVLISRRMLKARHKVRLSN